jgi:hypothetical protein
MIVLPGVSTTIRPKMTAPAAQIAKIIPMPIAEPTAAPAFAASELAVAMPSLLAFIPATDHKSIKPLKSQKANKKILPKNPRLRLSVRVTLANSASSKGLSVDKGHVPAQ